MSRSPKFISKSGSRALRLSSPLKRAACSLALAAACGALSATGFAGSFEVVASTMAADATLHDYTLCPSPGGKGEMVVLNFRRDEFFIAVDLATGETRQHSLSPGQAWGITTGQDGMVYLGTSRSPGALLLRYDPKTDKIEKVAEAEGEQILAWLETAPDGTIYAGAYPSTSLFEYRPADGKFENLGAMAPGQTHNAFGAVSRGGKVYSGIGMKEETLVEYDPVSRTHRDIWPKGWKTTHAPRVYLGEDDLVYVYPGIETGESKGKGLKISDSGGIEIVAKEQLGRQKVGCNPRSNAARPVLADGSRLVEITRDKIVVAPADGGERRTIALKYDSHIKPIFGFGFGPDGKIYGSSKPSVLFSFDPSSDRFENLLAVSPQAGQVYRKVASGGKVYMGSYTHAMIHVYDPAKPQEKTRTIGPIGAGQDRPVDMAVGGDGTIYISSFPGYGLRNGALTYFYPGEERFENFVNIIPDHSLNSLALDEGRRRIYVGTSNVGGNGTLPLQSDAIVAEWDMDGRKLLRTVQPVPGEKVVSALIVLPDGLICGLTSGGRWFGIDPATFETRFVQNLGGDAASIARLVFSESDQSVYGAAGRGVWKASAQAPAEVLMLGQYKGSGKNFDYGVEMDQSGRLYFADGNDLVRWTP